MQKAQRGAGLQATSKTVERVRSLHTGGRQSFLCPAVSRMESTLLGFVACDVPPNMPPRCSRWTR